MAVFPRNKKWWIGYTLSNGKYRREVVGSSYSLAKEALAKRQAEVAEGRFFPGRVANAKKFGDFAERFWDLHARHLKGRSWRLMINEAQRRFGQMRMSSVNTAELQRAYNEIAARASNSTANHHLVLWRLMFNKARAWNDFYGDNPCAGINRLRESSHRLRYLSVEEMERLLAVCHSRLYPVVACALLTGMRWGEILGLDWKNVSIDTNTIYILVSKSGKPRELPMGAKLRELLVTLGPKSEGKVFYLPYIMLRRYWERALAAAGIRDFRFHDLRHTFASHFIMRTNDLPTLQRLLGHSTPMMTLRYAHLSKGHLAKEMAIFESAMPVKLKGTTQVLTGPVDLYSLVN